MIVKKDYLFEYAKLGWKTTRSEGENIIRLSDGDKILTGVVQLFELLEEIKLVLSVSASSGEFNKFYEMIFGRPKDMVSLCLTTVTIRSSDIVQSDIQASSESAVAWWKKCILLKEVEKLTNFPNDTGMGQLKHLTALAYFRDFDTLMYYKNEMKQGQLHYFVPMIKVEMINRAIDLAFRE